MCGLQAGPPHSAREAASLPLSTRAVNGVPRMAGGHETNETRPTACQQAVLGRSQGPILPTGPGWGPVPMLGLDCQSQGPTLPTGPGWDPAYPGRVYMSFIFILPEALHS